MPVFPSDRRNVTIWIAFSCINYLYGSKSKCGPMLYSRECRSSHIHGVPPGTPTLQLEQMLSHSWEAVCTGGLLTVWVGFREQTWGFTDCKKNKSGPKKCLWKAQRVLLACPSKQSVLKNCAQQRERDSNDRGNSAPPYSQESSPQAVFVLFIFVLFTHPFPAYCSTWHFLLIKSSFFQVTTWISAVLSAGLCQ